jgi:chromosome segregation protein
MRARAELDALDSDIAAQSALVSAHDMRITKLRGAADAAASRLEAVRAGVERQQRALDAALARRAEAEEALAGVDPELVTEGSSAEHAAAYERAQRDATAAENEVGAIRERLHAAERERESLTAQTAALGRALDVRNAAAEMIAVGGAGIRGLVGDAVKVRSGYEAAIAAALGALAEGCSSTTSTRVSPPLALRATPTSDGSTSRSPTWKRARRGGDPRGAIAAAEVVTAPAGILGILARVLIVDDLDSAHAVRRRIIDVPDAATTIVTRAGERVTSYTIHAGSGAGRSRLELAAERDAAAERLAEITVVADSLREALSDAQTTWNDARARTKDALQSLREHDAALAAHTEQVNRATVRHEAAVAECERLEAGLAQASSAVADAERARVANDAFEGAQQAPRPILDASARDGLLDALESARDREMRARLDVETLRERVRAGEGRVDQLVRQRERERAAAAEAARRAVIRRAQRALAAEVADALPPVLDSVDRSVTQARVELQLAEQARTALTAELTSLRAEEATVRERLGRLTESVHGLELQMHEKRLHVTSLLDRVRSELSLDEIFSLRNTARTFLCPRTKAKGVAYDRAAQRKRLQDAERKLGQLGASIRSRSRSTPRSSSGTRSSPSSSPISSRRAPTCRRSSRSSTNACRPSSSRPSRTRASLSARCSRSCSRAAPAASP